VITVEDLLVARAANDGGLVPEVLATFLAELDLAGTAPGLAPLLLERKLAAPELAAEWVVQARAAVSRRADAIYADAAVAHGGLEPAQVETLLKNAGPNAKRLGVRLVAAGLLDELRDVELVVRAREILQAEDYALLGRLRRHGFAVPEIVAALGPQRGARVSAGRATRAFPVRASASDLGIRKEPTVTVSASELARVPQALKPESSDAIFIDATERASRDEPAPVPSPSAEPTPSSKDTAEHNVVLPLPLSSSAEDVSSRDRTEGYKAGEAPRPELAGKMLKVISGYEIVRELGRGAMGIVYLAREETLRRQVALKVLPKSGDVDAVARFMREARAIAALDHPSIVPVYQYGEAEGNYFIAMRLIEGKSLKELARRPLAPKRAAAIAEQVALALAYAHDAGVIHRDVKPANILVEPGDRVWLVDFGIAKLDAEATLTHKGEMVGTPAYMSPEQSLLLPLTPQTDVYSLGAVLYTVLCGRPPFEGPTPLSVLPLVATVDPPAPRTLRAEIPPDLETIVLVAMMKEPERRYADASALAKDLRRFLDGEPIMGRRPSVGFKARRLARRHLRFVLGAGAAFALALGAWAWRGTFAQREAHAREEAAATERAALLRSARDALGAVDRARADRSSERAQKLAPLLQALDQAIQKVPSTTEDLELLRNDAKRLRAEEAQASIQEAREANRKGDVARSQAALATARILEPDDPALAALEVELKTAGLRPVKVTGALDGARVAWSTLDKDLRPTGDAGVVELSSGEGTFVAPVGAVRVRVSIPGRHEASIDLAIEDRPLTLDLPSLPRSLSETEGMVFVPPGSYPLGGRSTGSQRSKQTSERLAWGFLIDRTEVTRAAFAEFVAAKGYDTESFWDERGRAWLAERRRSGPLAGPKDVDLSAVARKDEPVTGVSLFEATAFAAWKRKALPTADEWEMAARGTLGLAFPWGDRFLPQAVRRGDAPQPVGQTPFDVSASGCFDLGGNVREWTRDHPKDHLGRDVLERSLVKGAAFSDGEREASALAKPAANLALDPGERRPDVGFRCVRELRAEDFPPR
jgi:formylglycine-generating enzyme required for sulfatase activity/predicted Ser/Thr protein kinase